MEDIKISVVNDHYADHQEQEYTYNYVYSNDRANKSQRYSSLYSDSVPARNGGGRISSRRTSSRNTTPYDRKQRLSSEVSIRTITIENLHYEV